MLEFVFQCHQILDNSLTLGVLLSVAAHRDGSVDIVDGTSLAQ